MTVLTNNGNATYDEAIRASVVQLQADLRAAAMEFGNRAGDELCPIYVAKVRQAQINHYRRGLAAARAASMTETNWIGALMALGATLDTAWHSMSIPSENGEYCSRGVAPEQTEGDQAKPNSVLA
jgi:hypothetical protein